MNTKDDLLIGANENYINKFKEKIESMAGIGIALPD